MGGAACVIIIAGQNLTGAALGAYEVFAYGLTGEEINVTPEEEIEIAQLFAEIQTESDGWVNRVRAEGDTGINIVTLGAQTVGNLSALCETAANNPLPHEAQEQLITFLEESKRKLDKWNKYLKKKAEQSEY
jgi:muramoyltetrapeptide carboxypeptidase LdcA involved in peptidoglycan recycling